MELILRLTAQGSYAKWEQKSGNLANQILDFLHEKDSATVEEIIEKLETNPWSHESILLTLLEMFAHGLIKEHRQMRIEYVHE